MKALFCTDGSENSWYAIEKALALIKKDFEIDIVTVIETDFLTTFVTFPHDLEEGFSEFKNAAEQLLEKTANYIESKNFTVGEKIVLNGHTACAILELISENIYNCVILGSHGKKGFRRWLGSVSSKISQKSSIPVFVVKPIKTPDDKDLKILVTADGTQNSYNAIRKSLEILDYEHSMIEILSVKAGIQDFPQEIREDKTWIESCLKKQDEIMSEILEKASEIFKKNNIQPDEKTLLEGNPAEEILKYTENNKKSLIVMGSHGREGISSLLLGSISKIILENSTAPVLIIHNKPLPNCHPALAAKQGEP